MTCTTQKKPEKFYRKKVDINCRVLKKELIFIGLFITNSTENDKRKLIVMKAHSSTKAKIDDSIIYNTDFRVSEQIENGYHFQKFFQIDRYERPIPIDKCWL